MEILSYNITLKYPKWPVLKQTVVNTINPHSYCVAKRDLDFEIALKESDYLIPDGIGIVMAARILKREKIDKIAGYDLFLHLMNQLDRNKGTCFFLGAAPATLQEIRKRADREYPNVKIHAYSPPFKSNFSQEDNKKMHKKVNAVSPDVLFVGMTAPKQEKWVRQNKEDLNAKIICSIGAVFDFYAGTVARAPHWIIKLGMEWLHRSLKNPKRLGVRNLKSNPEFIMEVLKAKIRG